MTENEVLVNLEQLHFPLRMAPLVGVQGYTPQAFQTQAYQQAYQGMLPPGYQPPYPNDTLSTNIFPNPP